MGALTDILQPKLGQRLNLVELDNRFASEMAERYPDNKLYHQDFLSLNLDEVLNGKAAIAGNFPYNISTQIIFRIIENRDKVSAMLGMFQKEVAERLCAGPGTKAYGIPSVLAALYFKRELLFEIPPEAFNPPPKVDSAIAWMERDESLDPDIPYKRIAQLVKLGFNQRRKTLRNSLKSISEGEEFPYSDKRPEQLEPIQFVEIAKSLEK